MLFTCADPVYFACGPIPTPIPSPPPDYYPASQWSVVVVSFHWCMGSNLVASPLQVSGSDFVRQINIGHINLTNDDDSK